MLAFLPAAQGMGEKEADPSSGPPVSTGSPTPDAPAPMTDIHDIRPPVPVGFGAPWLWPLLAALAVVAVIGVLWWGWRKRRRPQMVETIIPELPPESVAMRALDDIGDPRRLDGKTFYFRLSAILRRYAHGRFAVGAPEMTTEEFVPCIDRLPVEKELIQRLKQLCRAMDPVKYGDGRTSEKQMQTDLLFARTFVRRTTLAADTDNQPHAEGRKAFQSTNLRQYPSSNNQKKN